MRVPLFLGRQHADARVEPGFVPLAALTLIGATTFGACVGISIDREPNAPFVSNPTGETVQLMVIVDGQRTPISTIEAGVTVSLGIYEDQCTSDVLLAQSLAGNEIDRRTEPLCPKESWIIGD